MSIKDLFDKGLSLKFVKNKTKSDLSEVESSRYIDAHNQRKDRFIPDVNFATASNFAHFGLAEEYYDSSIKRVYQTYPYDGSQAEKIEWENESTYLDLFLFENEYPRSNGYVLLGITSSFTGDFNTNRVKLSTTPQYIFLKGGPHADSGGDYKSDFSAGPSKTGISKANIYHTASQRTNNLELDPVKGVTTEFWMKKEGWASVSTTHHEYLLHSWNSGSLAGDAATNGSLRAYVYGETADSKGLIHVRAVSGSTHLNFNHDTGLSDIADSKWHHYSFTVKTEGSATISHLYVDGKHASKLSSASTINAVTGTMVAAIGGLVGPLTGSTNIGKGWGNIVSASFDEFRYWKTDRNAQEIGRFYHDQIGGGTNTDNVKYNDTFNKVNLGVYYKFNEGITEVPATDSTILDYSGRISNGIFVNYIAESRNTGSAIVLAGAASKEFKDPIVYSTHPAVASLAEGKRKQAEAYDHENTVSLYKSLPAWILEEDESSSNNLKYLTQIIASYFDDAYLQIQKLPTLKDINYPDDNSYEKPLPFAERLLSSRGYDAPELFANVSDLAKYLQRDEKKLFEKKLHEVKNIIYQNIYNNLSYIQKSKGTTKSLRNFLRCFGVDEELIKLNIYSNNDVYEFKDNTTHTAIRKNYIDFDDLETRLTASSGAGYDDAYTATAYQYYDVNDPANSLSYIPAATENLLAAPSITIETEVIFPKRSINNDKNHLLFAHTTSSIFGMNAVVASNTDLTYDSSDTINFNVVAVRTDDDSRNVKFGLRTIGGSSVFDNITTSDSFLSVYDNEKWNFAFRLRPTKARTDTGPALNTSTGFLKPAASAYTYELYGVNYLSNILQNEFVLSGTMSEANANTFFTKPKRVFLGASRTNFTGSVKTPSDVKVSSTRVWLDYLSDETIRAHARDANSYGALQPYRNANDSFNTNYVPQISNLILNWTMDNVTGSNASGQFLIEDFASGSVHDKLRFGDSWSRPINRHNYSGRGDKFTTNVNFADQAIDVEFVQSAKLKLPELANDDDMVKVLNKQDDVVFTRDTTYVQHLLSVEKSMYQIVSEEMLRLFATMTEFNNLIGEPVNRYRPHYKSLEKLRQLFFENVESDTLDLEKFIEYFKWVDDAVTVMIKQLIPASSNTPELLRNMIESHILERNKYWTKFPTLEIKSKEPTPSISAIEELKYNWKFGHAPVNPEQNTNQDENCLWWNQRAERDGVLASGDDNVDADKAALLKITVTEVTGAEPTLKSISGLKYAKSYYHDRSLARLVDLKTKKSLKIKGGSNPENNKIHDFYKGVTKWGSDDDFIYIDIDNELKDTVCNDKEIPDEINKKKFNIRSLTMKSTEILDPIVISGNLPTRGENDLKYTDARSTLLLPFSIYSSSIDTGYQKLYASQFKIDFTNLHEDKYGNDAEIPLQGPFTEKYVGGMQHRHVKLNQGADTPMTRPEGWHLQSFLNTDSSEEIINESFDGSDGGGTTDTRILKLPAGSTSGSTSPDPGDYEYWRNGVGAENEWTFRTGPTPSAGTGPTGESQTYVYCEVLPSKVGQTFGLVTPLIDLLDYSKETHIVGSFLYNMFGPHIGELKVQISSDPAFETDVRDIPVTWDVTGTPFGGTSLAGQQHANGETFSVAMFASNAYGEGLKGYVGRRFFIRLFYTAGISHLGDVAIDTFALHVGLTGDIYRNSFKLLSPTHDNHFRPQAIYTRDMVAKRPVNIKNIEMTGSSPTVAGNYLNRYEYVSTVSPEANDPYFVKNNDQITQTTMRYLTTGSIQSALAHSSASSRTDLIYADYTLPDRSNLTASVRNRTRIKSRFSSPGGFETLSRGFLDPAHETFSVYNALTYRNAWTRKVYNSQLQAHMGRFGASGHSTGSARVYGTETTGSGARALDYSLNGDASIHRYHRNNVERLVRPGFENSHAASLDGTNDYFEAADNNSLSFGDASDDTAFSISAWVKMDDATSFPIVAKHEPATDTAFFEYKLATLNNDKLYFYTYDNGAGTNMKFVSDSTLTSYEGQWIHLVATAGAGGDTKVMKVYINGESLAGSVTETGTYVAMHNTAAKLFIGRDDIFAGDSSFFYADGMIDEVSIWGTELTPTEIKEIYYGAPSDKAGPGPTDLARHSQYSNLVSWWRFGDGYGDFSNLSFVVDQKSNNTLTGKNAPSLAAGHDAGLIKVTKNDNAFVSHMIPRTDQQTRWITASII